MNTVSLKDVHSAFATSMLEHCTKVMFENGIPTDQITNISEQIKEDFDLGEIKIRKPSAPRAKKGTSTNTSSNIRLNNTMTSFKKVATELDKERWTVVDWFDESLVYMTDNKVTLICYVAEDTKYGFGVATSNKQFRRLTRKEAERLAKMKITTAEAFVDDDYEPVDNQRYFDYYVEVMGSLYEAREEEFQH